MEPQRNWPKNGGWPWCYKYNLPFRLQNIRVVLVESSEKFGYRFSKFKAFIWISDILWYRHQTGVGTWGRCRDSEEDHVMFYFSVYWWLGECEPVISQNLIIKIHQHFKNSAKLHLGTLVQLHFHICIQETFFIFLFLFKLRFCALFLWLQCAIWALF